MPKPGSENYRFSLTLLIGIAVLSAAAPFSIDMYLPALPGIAADFGTTQPMVQLTLSGFVIGLAVGQLVIGPLSDALGRQKLMIAGAVLALVAAIAAALAPTIWVLITARVLQGLGSGACMVASRAVIPDLASGRRAAKAFAAMMSIQTLAPVLAPVVGGLLVEPIGWRGLFWVLAGLALVQLGSAVFIIPESRPAHLREKVTVTSVARNYRYVIANAGFRGYLLVVVCAFGALFSYLSASSFMIQGEMGYSPRTFSFIFGFNAVGLLLGNIINARLIDRFDPRYLVRYAAGAQLLAAGALLAVVGTGGAPEGVIFALLFLFVSHQGFVQANSMSLGTLQVRSRAGGASALMGFFQFVVAGAIGPVVGLGSSAGVAMSLSMAVVASVSVVYL
ncbi:Bcr/CflA family drug resistance efflux transporter [Corynebacterium yudongzhengii]|uniref:Bcr/CflA family drug resistance efflux transporter n=1 Tax=Corynebacterium yudongzhengii TaxID=2080740 RepID=A0A2U1T4U5_9CORY|nr:multidrug effflux MFS transporter [Corynebacterium yudongzhengii]PWC01024.1 Bcr/CflA family drug resistance efflux transporter [Corynebacterium yudongzhengii]